MSAIEDFIIDVFNEYGVPLFENGSPFKKKQDAAYAELAALRATITEFEADKKIRDNALSDILSADRAIIAEQARQLTIAYRLIDAAKNAAADNRGGWFYMACVSWLAANAPAPQAQSEQE